MKKGFVSLFGLVAIVIIVAVAFMVGPRFASRAASIKPHFSNGYPQLNLTYHGGPVMAGTTSVYAIFWEPTGNVSANYNALIKRFLGDFGGSALYKVASQYTQTGGGSPMNAVLAGTWVDSTAYIRNPLWESDIQSSVTRAQQANGWTSSLNNLFLVFTERNVNFCGSLSTQCTVPCGDLSHFGTDTIYAAVPYAGANCNFSLGPNHDDADGAINALSSIEMDAVTNPLGSAWYRSSNGSQTDIGGPCLWTFGPVDSQSADVVWNGNPYLVQREWDNKTSSCILSSSTSSITYYEFVNHNSALALDVSGGSNNPGTQIVQWTNDGGFTQQWSLVPDGPYYQIVNRSSGLVLDVSGGSTSVGAHIVQSTNSNSTSQQWALRPQGGYQGFFNMKSDLVLDVSGESTSIGASVVQTQWGGSFGLGQQWSLMPGRPAFYGNPPRVPVPGNGS